MNHECPKCKVVHTYRLLAVTEVGLTYRAGCGHTIVVESEATKRLIKFG